MDSARPFQRRAYPFRGLPRAGNARTRPVRAQRARAWAHLCAHSRVRGVRRVRAARAPARRCAQLAGEPRRERDDRCRDRDADRLARGGRRAGHGDRAAALPPHRSAARGRPRQQPDRRAAIRALLSGQVRRGRRVHQPLVAGRRRGQVGVAAAVARGFQALVERARADGLARQGVPLAGRSRHAARAAARVRCELQVVRRRPDAELPRAAVVRHRNLHLHADGRHGRPRRDDAARLGAALERNRGRIARARRAARDRRIRRAARVVLPARGAREAAHRDRGRVWRAERLQRGARRAAQCSDEAARCQGAVRAAARLTAHAGQRAATLRAAPARAALREADRQPIA
mmetsp:Transcript_11793/g.37390  ORF Transcript_11793/g.37390 Transcript_11793/m.37390 type:complete len:346 (+) Transcript_11793:13-1050(+)